jgi:intracellular multiplication protein IcmP
VARSSRAGAAIGSDDYTGFSLILIVVGLCILGCASWHVWHAQISRIALLVAHFEMEAIDVVTDRFRPADIAVQRAHPDGVQFGQLVRLYRNIGQEFVYPAMALVLALAGLCFLRAGNARFTRTFDLEKLMAEQAIHSRSTAAFVGRGFKLSKLRAGEPRPADAALHVDEWVARYASSEKSGFDEAAARREFMRQLGGRWTGPAAASEPCAACSRSSRCRASSAATKRLRCLDSCRRGCHAAKPSPGPGRKSRSPSIRRRFVSPIACSRRWTSPPGPSTSWRSIILRHQASCRS